MNLDARQYDQITKLVFDDKPAPTPAEAELVIGICQLAVAADDVEDADEAALFEAIARQVYGHAKLKTDVPTYHPIDDDEQRRDLIKSSAAQLAGKPAAELAYALAYILAVADLDLAPEEGELLEELGEALGIDPDRADELIVGVTEIVTPEE